MMLMLRVVDVMAMLYTHQAHIRHTAQTPNFVCLFFKKILFSMSVQRLLFKRYFYSVSLAACVCVCVCAFCGLCIINPKRTNIFMQKPWKTTTIIV